MGKVILDQHDNLCIVYMTEHKELSRISGHPVLIPKCHVQASPDGTITGFDETGSRYADLDRYLKANPETAEELSVLKELVENNKMMPNKELQKLLQKKLSQDQDQKEKVQDKKKKRTARRARQQEQEISLADGLTLAASIALENEELKDPEERDLGPQL